MLKKCILILLTLTTQLNGMIYVGRASIQNCSEGKAPQNEDRILLKANPGYNNVDLLFGIFDGHGGYLVSDFAKNNLNRHVEHSFRTKLQYGYTGDMVIKDALLNLDNEILSQEALDNCGTTALVGCIRNNQIHIANVGDSRAMIVFLDGKKVFTEEHKPRPESADSKLIQQKGGSIVITYKFIRDDKLYCLEERRFLKQGKPITEWSEQDLRLYQTRDVDENNPYLRALKSDSQQTFLESCQDFRKEYFVGICKETAQKTFFSRMGMSRSIGDKSYKNAGTTAKADLYSFDIPDLSYAILASDGFWDVYTPEQAQQEINQLTRQSFDANEICQKIAGSARKHGSDDDISVVLLLFKQGNQA